MAALRRLLVCCSALTAIIIFATWVFASRELDILPFGLIVLFSANAFYLHFSRPTVQASDILERASSKLTLVSLELRHLSKQARAREEEAEKIRIANTEKEKYKLQVAKDMLEYMQLEIPSIRIPTSEAHQTTHLPRIGNEILAQLIAKPKPKPGAIEGPLAANLPMEKDGQPTTPNVMSTAAICLN